MHQSNHRRLPCGPALAAFSLLCAASLSGCSRGYYRQDADEEAYRLVGNAASDPRWLLPNYTIAADGKSRFFDPSDPDNPPMPPDDPTSHKLMHEVDHMRGYPYWHKNGEIHAVDSPDWRSYLPTNEQGELVIDHDLAIQLALVNSRDYQSQLETLYLSALDVSFERFLFDVQFFGGNDTFLTADARERSGRGRSSTILQTDTDLQMQKAFAAGGQLTANFANSFMWQFAGPDSETAFSIFDFTFIQPLLRMGGRARVLERLTLVERTLLANVRQMERYRRGFYVDITTGSGGQQGPNRRGGLFGGSGLTGFTGVGAGGFGRVGGFGGGGGGNQGFAGGAGAARAGGFYGLLQDAREIENQEVNITLLRNVVTRFKAFQEAGRVDALQLGQVQQSLYNNESQLITRKAGYQSSLDAFLFELGLPPEQCSRIDDDLLDEFELLSPELLGLQDQATALLSRMWARPDKAERTADDDLAAARAKLERNILTVESARDLLDLSRFMTPAAGGGANVTEVRGLQGELEAMLRDLRLLEQSLDQLESYPAALPVAEELQQLAEGHLGEVGDSVREMQSALPDRIAGLRRLAERDEVKSGKVDRDVFDENELRRLVAEQVADFSAIRERLEQPLELWERERVGLQGFRRPVLATVEKVDEELATWRGEVQALEERRVNLPGGGDAQPADPAQSERVLEDFAVDLARFADTSAADKTFGEVNNLLQKQVAPLGGALQSALLKVTQLNDDVTDLSLIQARSRLETSAINPVDLQSCEAFFIASQNRVDWMNSRASVVDAWRLIEFNADDLESDLDIVFQGDIGTTQDDPFRFRDANGRLRVGLQYDAPLTRLAERNNYRESLINYQQARRSYMQFVDSVSFGLRNTLRTLALNEVNFELRRKAVHLAINQVELALLRLNEPPRQSQGADPAAASSASFGPTAARDLVQAIADLLQAQNDYLSVWVNSEVQRMSLDLDLGTMQLDERGMWIDPGKYIGKAGAVVDPFCPTPAQGGEADASAQAEAEWPELLPTPAAAESDGAHTESGREDASRTEATEAHAEDQSTQRSEE